MEHSNSPVEFAVGERKLALRLTFRARRLLKERGFDLLKADTRNQLADYITDVIWAASQHKENGKPEDWPAFEWIEENLEFRDLPRITEAMRRMMETASKAADQLGNGVPEASPSLSNGLTSGQSESSTLESTPTISGN